MNLNVLSVCDLLAQVGRPVNILDMQNWDQSSVCAPCAYTGLLHYHHPSMQSGAEYLLRDQLSTMY